MQEIRQDLKDIKDDLTFLKVETSKNTLSLETHMRRTAASEERIMYLERVLMGLAGIAVLGGVIKLLVS